MLKFVAAIVMAKISLSIDGYHCGRISIFFAQRTFSPRGIATGC
jgi:hypothetical protein